MNNFREVNDDILRDWLSFREEMVFVRCLLKIKNIAYILKKYPKEY